jgi:hypothetical protein
MKLWIYSTHICQSTATATSTTTTTTTNTVTTKFWTKTKRMSRKREKQKYNTEKENKACVREDIFRTLRRPKFRHRVYKSPHLDLILGVLNPLHTPTSYWDNKTRKNDHEEKKREKTMKENKRKYRCIMRNKRKLLNDRKWKRRRKSRTRQKTNRFVALHSRVLYAERNATNHRRLPVNLGLKS